jgi:uncharacterized Zn finger protein
METSDESSSQGLGCARCGAVMRIARRLPKLGANPELVSYQCEQCGHVVTQPEDDGS